MSQELVTRLPFRRPLDQAGDIHAAPARVMTSPYPEKPVFSPGGIGQGDDTFVRFDRSRTVLAATAWVSVEVSTCRRWAGPRSCSSSQRAKFSEAVPPSAPLPAMVDVGVSAAGEVGGTGHCSIPTSCVPWWAAILIAVTATAIGYAIDAGSGQGANPSSLPAAISPAAWGGPGHWQRRTCSPRRPAATDISCLGPTGCSTGHDRIKFSTFLITALPLIERFPVDAARLPRALLIDWSGGIASSHASPGSSAR